jgi:hypothetical protein
MAVIEGRTTLKSFFETGDKPTQDQFARMIESMVVLPTNGTGASIGAVGLSILQASTTASAVAAIGATQVGTEIIVANTTSSALGQLGATTLGRSILEANTTASAFANLGLTPLNTESIAGQIETPVTGAYVLEQYAPYAYTVEWLRFQTVSGQAQITGKIDGVNITGIVSAAADTTEGAASATSNNAVAVGQTLRLDITSVSGAAKLSFTMKIVRT